MSYFISSTPVEKLNLNYGVCVGNVHITVEGRHKDLIEDKWIGMVKVTAIQQATSQGFSSESSSLLAEFLAWYLKEMTCILPADLILNDDTLFGPGSFLCNYELPTHRMFKCLDKLTSDLSILFAANNIIRSNEGNILSRVKLTGKFNLGPLSEIKALEVFQKDKSTMLVGSFKFPIEQQKSGEGGSQTRKPKT